MAPSAMMLGWLILMVLRVLLGRARRLRINVANRLSQSNQSALRPLSILSECERQYKRFASRCKQLCARAYRLLDSQQQCSLACDEVLKPGHEIEAFDASRSPLSRVDAIWQGKSALPWAESCGGIVQPALWTGGIIDAIGFVEFLHANEGIRLLDHAEGRHRQTSIFGSSMDAAGYLDACSSDVRRSLWKIGSKAYARFYSEGAFTANLNLDCEALSGSSARVRATSVVNTSVYGSARDLDDVGDLRTTGRTSNEWHRIPAAMRRRRSETRTKRYFFMLAFVGHKFGLRRNGKNSIFFEFEIPSLFEVANSKRTGNYLGDLGIANFGPQPCSDLVDIETEYTFQHLSLTQIYKRSSIRKFAQQQAERPHDHSHLHMRNLRFFCMDCNPADRLGGPSRDEIEICIGKLKSAKRAVNSAARMRRMKNATLAIGNDVVI